MIQSQWMKKIIRIVILVLFCLYCAFFIIGSSLAPIFAHFGLYEPSAILTSPLMYSCHQQPTRSFWFLGYPVAICCRCYGFYLGVCITTIFAIFNKLNIKLKTLLILIMLCITDITINCLFSTNTGNYTRFIIGILMGLIFVRLLCYIFEIRKGEKNEK